MSGFAVSFMVSRDVGDFGTSREDWCQGLTQGSLQAEISEDDDCRWAVLRMGGQKWPEVAVRIAIGEKPARLAAEGFGGGLSELAHGTMPRFANLTLARRLAMGDFRITPEAGA